MDTPKKLFKVVTHNTMIETFEVEASTMAEAKQACFDCWTAEDNYPSNVERVEQYFDDKSVQKCKLFAIECSIDNDNLLSTSSVGFWREPTIQELDSEEIS